MLTTYSAVKNLDQERVPLNAYCLQYCGRKLLPGCCIEKIIKGNLIWWQTDQN